MPTRLMMTLMGVPAQLIIADSTPRETVAELTAQWRDVIDEGAVSAEFTALVGTAPDAAHLPGVEVHVEPTPVDNLGERLAAQLTLAALRRMSGRALMLHAGAIALDDGRVIGFVGPSGRGKTTAMSVLAKTHRYVTDETLVVRADGTVIPYPKPLLIGRRPDTKRAHSASSLGLRPVGAGDLRLAALVLLDRRADAATPTVESVDLIDAMIELTSESSYLTQLDAPLAMFARLLRETGGARRVSYAEAETLPGMLEEILSLHAEAVAPVVTLDVAVSPATGEGWSRAPHTDALRIGDRIVVLHDQTISVLEGIATTVWRTADGSTERALEEAAVREHGAPPSGTDAAAVVAGVLEELTAAALVRRG